MTRLVTLVLAFALAGSALAQERKRIDKAADLPRFNYKVDAKLDTAVTLPSPCFAPIVFVTTPGGAWLAVSGL